MGSIPALFGSKPSVVLKCYFADANEGVTENPKVVGERLGHKRAHPPTVGAGLLARIQREDKRRAARYPAAVCDRRTVLIPRPIRMPTRTAMPQVGRDATPWG